MLLYHGLGSGKTCSAIGVAEEMRDYLRQMGRSEKIMVVASPNVQNNFKSQLFDERKLKQENGVWNLRACVGSKYLKEINPMNTTGMSRDHVIKQVERIIKASYMFFGYTQFANYISNMSSVKSDVNNKNEVMKRKLNSVFNNRLIIIDEVHNIRITDDNESKHVAKELFKMVTHVKSVKLLLLSGTPLYNSYEEIVWLLNIMNLNDGRSQIKVNDVFNKDGSFKENGKELLERKATGYISYVRGETPYVFPYRIWPKEFDQSRSLLHDENAERGATTQFNGKNIVSQIEMLDVYKTEMGSYQKKGYEYIMNDVLEKISEEFENFNELDGFGYTILQRPLEGLNIIYPNKSFDDDNSKIDIKELVGKSGLKNVMSFTETQTNPPLKYDFEYLSEDYGRVFSPDEIGKYSGKIKSICDAILSSTGVVLVYSQYINGGVVPVALALEELGFTQREK